MSLDGGPVGPSPSCAERAAIASTLPLDTVSPVATDPALSALPLQVWGEPHGDPTGKLFVFLSGLGSTPDDYRQIVQHAAAAGYHAIGLAYANTDYLASLCAGDPGPDCTGDIRREVITGADRSPLVDVDATHSIDHRLTAFLEHVGWTQYVSSGQPRWEDIVVAGHSLGGGNAMMIAQLRLVHRAVAFAQPWEATGWTLDPVTSPPDRLFGFVHANEPDAGDVTAAWNNLGVPGAPTSVDGSAPPYGGSHQLITSIAVTNPHNAIVLDVDIPLDPALTPLFAPVWCYMLGP